ncbi:MAG: HNH endonuclease [Nitrospiraceae bacterium]
MKSYRKAAKARRRSSISSSGKTITHSEWMGMIQLFENKCAYCHEIMEVPTQDHVIPLSKGGTHTYDNIMQACMSCNQRKKDRSLDDFLADPNRKMPKRK